MRSSNLSILWGAIIFAILTSFVAYLFVESGSPFKVCIPTEGPATEQHQKAIAALDGVADIGIKLSTTLVGIGAAVLLGFKSGLKLTIPIRIIILFATACFLQSTLYAVLWRLRVAELWLNDCLTLISEPRLEYRYQAHFIFFLAGLFWLGILVVGASLTQQASAPGEET